MFCNNSMTLDISATPFYEKINQIKLKYIVEHRSEFEEYMLCESSPDLIHDEHDVPSMVHASEVLGNVTYAPLGRIALYAYTLDLREERRLLNLHEHEVTLLGRCVEYAIIGCARRKGQIRQT